MPVKHSRPAIAMIELIFAIVVMGIVMMSAPMLISTASKTTNVALQQEGINEASSRLNMILTYAWDQNDTNESCVPPVLHVTSGDNELDINATTKRRAGVDINSSSHTSLCLSTELNASAIGADGVVNDIDDFIGNISLVIDASGTNGTDYIEKNTVRMRTAVSYANDNALYNGTNFTYIPTLGGAGTSNIKQIVVTLDSNSTASELNTKSITLRAFSSNVGGFQYESRIIP